MIAFPNCKINLGLLILDKRPDGFHNLQTVFFPVPLKDSLEIIRLADGDSQEEISFSVSGIPVDGETTNNLCIKAWHLLKKDFPGLPKIKMHLHKAIPLGAGLGGGSADAAFTLSLLNKKFQLGLTTQQLFQYALVLGSDCPFFIVNKPCLATGRGEILTEININLSDYQIIIVNPGIHVNTGWAFTQLNREVNLVSTSQPEDLTSIIQQPVSTWKNRLVNDFEAPVFKQYPPIGAIKEALYQKGAVYAAMSGSGSSVLGLFNKTVSPEFQFPNTYFLQTIPLSEC